jgi:two-component system response regulator RegA
VTEKTVLIVDDDPVFRRRLAQALAERGFEVQSASGHDEAVAIAAEWKPRRAVVDLRMEGLSGLHVLRGLRSLVPGIQVVILTGYGSIATTVEAMRGGAHGYVAKPADVDDILNAFATPKEAASPPSRPLSLARIEWEVISRTLVECDGNVSEAARKLGIHRRTLQRKLAKFAPPED